MSFDAITLTVLEYTHPLATAHGSPPSQPSSHPLKGTQSLHNVAFHHHQTTTQKATFLT